MTKDAISDYSATAGSNTDVGGVNIDEGCPPSGINNAIRELMSHLADLNAGTTSLGTIKVDNLQLDGNAITSTDTNGDVTITPNGTGDVVIDGLKYPQADGSTGQFLKTDGSGQLAFATVGSSIPSGTKMLFAQTAAPTGFTKDTSNNNNSAIRIVTGTAGTGGSVDFTTAFATPSVSGSVGLSGDLAAGNLAVAMSGSISNTTLTTSEIPSHTHNFKMTNSNSSSNNAQALSSTAERKYSANNQGATSSLRNIQSSGGNGGSHNHAHNLSGTLSGTPSVGNLAGSLSSATATINVKYVDVIVATKD